MTVKAKKDKNGLETALSIMGGKWRTQVVDNLMEGEKRFSELYRSMPRVTKKMLVKVLRELEAAGIVKQLACAGDGTRKAYGLTDMGKDMEASLEALKNWGRTYQRNKGNKE